MSNPINIYRRQARELGLNTKQYAELIDMPYDIVKDFFYDKEGDYSMEIKNLFRKNMLDKHQEIENNFENAKFKAYEIKYKTTSAPQEWYEQTYTPELLCDVLKIKTRAEFERNYDILVDGKRASKWFYVNITGKRNYDNHEISKNVLDQFIEQLYDILVNGNGDKYKRETPTETKVFQTQRKPIKSHKYKNKYFEWFRDFDIKAYLKENNLTYVKLANKLNLGVYTIHQLVNKKHYTKRTLEKLYRYVNEQEYNNIAQNYIDKHNIKVDNAMLDNSTSELVDDSTCQVELDDKDDNNTTTKHSSVEERAINLAKEYEQVRQNYMRENTTRVITKYVSENDEILRKILINRLTDEEKELIRIFGGKIC